MKNFSFAAQRFDSLSAPLIKIVALLPSILRFLSKLTQLGDADDQRWARRILEVLTCREGGQHLVKAAMVGDAMLILQKFLRMDDAADSPVIIKAQEAGFVEYALCFWPREFVRFLPSRAGVGSCPHNARDVSEARRSGSGWQRYAHSKSLADHAGYGCASLLGRIPAGGWSILRSPTELIWRAIA